MLDLPLKQLTLLKYYCSTEKITKLYNEQLPQWKVRTGCVFLSDFLVPGKSTMIYRFLLNVAQKFGVLLPDPYHTAGVNFQTDLIQDLNRGCFARTD